MSTIPVKESSSSCTKHTSLNRICPRSLVRKIKDLSAITLGPDYTHLSHSLYRRRLAMPTIQPGSKVLVTGGNGYIGAWAIHTLLSKGFSVRAVVRSEEKAKPLREHFAEHEQDAKVKASVVNGRLEFVYVPDFVKEGAFEEVIEGVEGVLHIASPITTQNGPADGTYRFPFPYLDIY